MSNLKVVSFSLWGTNSRYYNNFKANIEAIRKWYSGWESWVYVDYNTVTQESIDTLIKFGYIVKEKRGNGTAYCGLMWRFEPAFILDIEIMVSRDLDSIIGEREAIAVSEWLLSNKDFHIIRDHKKHGLRILGGLWGVRNRLLMRHDQLKESMNNFICEKWNDDQDFLGKEVYPRIKNNSLIHDEFNLLNDGGVKVRHQWTDDCFMGRVQ